MKLEIIATNLSDVKMINESNADRIEFCSHLELGGLTPSYEDILQALKISSLPINIMVRPTNRDFYYTEAEFQQMLVDVEFISQTSANGIVVGIINPDQTINVERMQAIIAKANGKQITFHRAFEHLKEPFESVKILADLGVDSILTSGTGDIDNSLDLLKLLTDLNQVKVIAGGGINFTNIDQISDCADEIHIGTVVRKNQSWNHEILVPKINEIKAKIQNK